MFDPWSATEDEALQAADADRLVVRHLLPARSPLNRWWAAQELLSNRASIELGRGFDVLAGVALCAQHELVMPEWLASQYLARYKMVAEKRAASWSDPEVFGAPYPPGASIASDRKRHLDLVEVMQIVRQYMCRCEGEPLTKLWARFASSLEPTQDEIAFFGPSILRRVQAVGCKKSKAQELLKDAKEMFGWPMPINRTALDDPLPDCASAVRRRLIVRG